MKITIASIAAILLAAILGDLTKLQNVPAALGCLGVLGLVTRSILWINE